MWPSLVMYSCVSYWAILKVAFYGKKVCGHDPSSKEGLKAANKDISTEAESLDEVSTAVPQGADVSEEDITTRV